MPDISTFTAEQRAEALYYYFGWQGGTIHQLARETGISSTDLLHRANGTEPLSHGFSAIRTCDKTWRVEKLALQHKGDWAYWRDVIIGYWATGALGATAS
jgi:hypothetical protein